MNLNSSLESQESIKPKSANLQFGNSLKSTVTGIEIEEEKQSAVHLAIAKRIVDTLSDGECHVTHQAALQVLKPLLEDFIGPGILKKHKIPE